VAEDAAAQRLWLTEGEEGREAQADVLRLRAELERLRRE